MDKQKQERENMIYFLEYVVSLAYSSKITLKELAFWAFREVSYGVGSSGFGAAVNYLASKIGNFLVDIKGDREPRDFLVVAMRNYEQEYLKSLN